MQKYYQQHKTQHTLETIEYSHSSRSRKNREFVQTSNSFRCDGRTHCSQMNSCEEATYFLKNCPNTKMDGNGDGIPCEKQWCK